MLSNQCEMMTEIFRKYKKYYVLDSFPRHSFLCQKRSHFTLCKVNLCEILCACDACVCDVKVAYQLSSSSIVIQCGKWARTANFGPTPTNLHFTGQEISMGRWHTKLRELARIQAHLLRNASQWLTFMIELKTPQRQVTARRPPHTCPASTSEGKICHSKNKGQPKQTM